MVLSRVLLSFHQGSTHPQPLGEAALLPLFVSEKKTYRSGIEPHAGRGVAGALQIKKPAAPYSRAGGSRTTLGEEALDFRVRDGNGYCRLSKATGRKPEIGSEENRNAERREPHTW